LAASADEEYSLDFLLTQWIEQELASAGCEGEATAMTVAQATPAAAGAHVAALEGGSTVCDKGPAAATTTAPAAAAAAASNCGATPRMAELAWQQQQQQAAAMEYEAAAAALGAELMSSIAAAGSVPGGSFSMRPMTAFALSSNNLASYAVAAGRDVRYSSEVTAAVPPAAAAAVPVLHCGVPLAQQHGAAAAPSALASKLADLCAQFYTVSQELQNLQQQQQQQLIAYDMAVQAASSSQQVAVTGYAAGTASSPFIGQPPMNGYYQNTILVPTAVVPASRPMAPFAGAGFMGC
jgi:hypothetical protein